MAPLDPWIIEQIKKREEEKRRREEGIQPTVPADDPREIPAERDRGHEMPAERTPGYEMPNPNVPAPKPSEKKDEGERRGVDISRISGNDEEDEEDGSSITIDISKIPPMPDEGEKKDPKRPD